MVKITKASLAQLAQEMRVLAGQEQKECIGGVSSTYSQFGDSLKETRVEDFFSVHNSLSTQIGEAGTPYASCMLFELEAPRRQHNTFATAFIEELDSAVSTSGGIGATDEFGSGSIDADGIDADGIGSGGIGSGGIDDSDDVSKKPKRRSFDECQKIVFENEGGWSNHPNDRGGKTNFGISESTFNSYKRRHPEAGLTDISKLTKKQAREIYKNDFWDSMKADELESGNVALLLYDMQVNHGGKNAALIAQRAINSLGGNVTVDSAWGSQTRGQLNALSEQNEQRLCEAILRERKRFYQDIIHKNPSQNVFSNGWNNRMEHLKDSLSY